MPDCLSAAVTPSVAGTASLRSPRNNPTLASADRRPSAALTTIQKRSTSQAQIRNDFINLMKRKSSANPPSAVPKSGHVVSSPVSKKFDELITELVTAPVTVEMSFPLMFLFWTGQMRLLGMIRLTMAIMKPVVRLRMIEQCQW